MKIVKHTLHFNVFSQQNIYLSKNVCKLLIILRFLQIIGYALEDLKNNFELSQPLTYVRLFCRGANIGALSRDLSDRKISFFLFLITECILCFQVFSLTVLLWRTFKNRTNQQSQDLISKSYKRRHSWINTLILINTQIFDWGLCMPLADSHMRIFHCHNKKGDAILGTECMDEQMKIIGYLIIVLLYFWNIAMSFFNQKLLFGEKNPLKRRYSPSISLRMAFLMVLPILELEDLDPGPRSTLIHATIYSFIILDLLEFYFYLPYKQKGICLFYSKAIGFLLTSQILLTIYRFSVKDTMSEEFLLIANGFIGIIVSWIFFELFKRKYLRIIQFYKKFKDMSPSEKELVLEELCRSFTKKIKKPSFSLIMVCLIMHHKSECRSSTCFCHSSQHNMSQEAFSRYISTLFDVACKPSPSVSRQDMQYFFFLYVSFECNFGENVLRAQYLLLKLEAQQRRSHRETHIFTTIFAKELERRIKVIYESDAKEIGKESSVTTKEQDIANFLFWEETSDSVKLKIVQLLKKKYYLWDRLQKGYSHLQEFAKEILKFIGELEKVEEILDQIPLMEEYYHVYALKLRSIFCAIGLNNIKDASKWEEKIDNLKKKGMMKDEEEMGITALLQNSITSIIASFLEDQGKIVKRSTNSGRFFGYLDDKEFQHRVTNIKHIMPTSVAEYHDYFVEKFLHRGHSDIVRKGRRIFCVGYDGLVFPAYVYLDHNYSFPNDFTMTAFIHKVSSRSRYMLLDGYANVIGFCPRFRKFLNKNSATIDANVEQLGNICIFIKKLFKIIKERHQNASNKGVKHLMLRETAKMILPLDIDKYRLYFNNELRKLKDQEIHGDKKLEALDKLEARSEKFKGREQRFRHFHVNLIIEEEHFDFKSKCLTFFILQFLNIIREKPTFNRESGLQTLKFSMCNNSRKCTELTESPSPNPESSNNLIKFEDILDSPNHEGFADKDHEASPHLRKRHKTSFHELMVDAKGGNHDFDGEKPFQWDAQVAELKLFTEKIFEVEEVNQFNHPFYKIAVSPKVLPSLVKDRIESPTNKRLDSPMNKRVNYSINKRVESPTNKRVESPINKRVEFKIKSTDETLLSPVHFNQKLNTQRSSRSFENFDAFYPEVIDEKNEESSSDNNKKKHEASKDSNPERDFKNLYQASSIGSVSVQSKGFLTGSISEIVKRERTPRVIRTLYVISGIQIAFFLILNVILALSIISSFKSFKDALTNIPLYQKYQNLYVLSQTLCYQYIVEREIPSLINGTNTESNISFLTQSEVEALDSIYKYYLEHLNVNMKDLVYSHLKRGIDTTFLIVYNEKLVNLKYLALGNENSTRKLVLIVFLEEILKFMDKIVYTLKNAGSLDQNTLINNFEETIYFLQENFQTFSDAMDSVNLELDRQLNLSYDKVSIQNTVCFSIGCAFCFLIIIMVIPIYRLYLKQFERNLGLFTRITDQEVDNDKMILLNTIKCLSDETYIENDFSEPFSLAYNNPLSRAEFMTHKTVKLQKVVRNKKQNTLYVASRIRSNRLGYLAFVIKLVITFLMIFSYFMSLFLVVQRINKGFSPMMKTNYSFLRYALEKGKSFQNLEKLMQKIILKEKYQYSRIKLEPADYDLFSKTTKKSKEELTNLLKIITVTDFYRAEFLEDINKFLSGNVCDRMGETITVGHNLIECGSLLEGSFKSGLLAVEAQIFKFSIQFLQFLSLNGTLTQRLKMEYLQNTFVLPKSMIFLSHVVYDELIKTISKENETIIDYYIMVTSVIFTCGCLLYTLTNSFFILFEYRKMKENLRRTLKLLSLIPFSKLADDLTLINMIKKLTI